MHDDIELAVKAFVTGIRLYRGKIFNIHELIYVNVCVYNAVNSIIKNIQFDKLDVNVVI